MKNFRKAKVTAIILAGGKSQRMGTNKAFLKYGNKTFIEHQIDKLSMIFEEIILSANEVQLFDSLKLPIVTDVMPGKGPLGGICAGLIYAGNFHSFAIACDMPFIDKEFILFLGGLTDGYDVVVPRSYRGLEPLHAYYSKNCIQPMFRCLKEGKLKMTDFLSKVKVRVVDENELRGLGISPQSLLNLNTPEEYQEYC